MLAKVQNLVQWVKIFKISNEAFLDPEYVTFWSFENFDPNLAKFDQILTQNLVKIDQNGHVRSFYHKYSQNPKFHGKMLFG